MAYVVVFFIGILGFFEITASPMKNKDNQGPPLVTCPGFPGYCSESYPGDTCLIVCAFGRNNVPECQSDGTWTDIPRCIEHEPGIPEQIPGICPGIPGYCSLDYPGALCEFDCISGPDIKSFCTPDGTWDPYPTCEGDIRETRDGCKECPGPFGGPRNRTLERLNGGNRSNTGNSRGSSSNNRRPGAHPPARHLQNNRNSSPFQNERRQKPNGNPQSSNPLPQQNFQSSFQQNRPINNEVAYNSNREGSSGRCPGKILDSCIDACPSFSTRIFKACVSGCGRRCPGRK